MTHIYTRNPIVGADLLDASPWDCARWTMNRLGSDRVASFFANTGVHRYDKIHDKLTKCCNWLNFYRDYSEPEGGRYPYKLLYTNFCQMRVCLLCQGRKANIWRKRLNHGIPKVEAMYPRHRWLFLTLTIKNVPLVELRQNIRHLHDSWRRLSRYGRDDGVKRRHRYKPFPAKGWIKSVEVTQPGDITMAHPHIHTLLFMPPSYFKAGNKYDWSHQDWVDSWRRSLRADYDPIVWISAVDKDKSGTTKVCEVAKYITKPSNLLFDAAWTREYSDQIHGCQLHNIGGVAFDGNPDFTPPREREDLIQKSNLFADTDERASFRWNGDRLGYDLF